MEYTTEYNPKHFFKFQKVYSFLSESNQIDISFERQFSFGSINMENKFLNLEINY